MGGVHSVRGVGGKGRGRGAAGILLYTTATNTIESTGLCCHRGAVLFGEI